MRNSTKNYSIPCRIYQPPQWSLFACLARPTSFLPEQQVRMTMSHIASILQLIFASRLHWWQRSYSPFKPPERLIFWIDRTRALCRQSRETTNTRGQSDTRVVRRKPGNPHWSGISCWRCDHHGVETWIWLMGSEIMKVHLHRPMRTICQPLQLS